MPFTAAGWVPEAQSPKLTQSTKKPGPYASPGWVAAANAQQYAATSGQPLPPNVSVPAPPKAGQMNGPALGNSAPMGLRDWQQMTGVYDAPVDRWKDTWTPTGFGVPGVPRGDINGLQDFYGRNIGENGVVDSLSVKPKEEVRLNGNNVFQKGKNLGGGGTPIDMTKSFDTLLQETGQVPYSSNQLPTTQSNPFSATQAQTPGFSTEVPDIDGYNGAAYDSGTGRQAAGSRDLSQFAPMTGNKSRIEGGSQRINNQETGISSGRLSEALNGVKSEVKDTPERRQMMARAAFLNADDSMSGLKARDAVNDVVYAGGQHYGRGALSDDAGIGDKYKIDRADARGIASGKNTAAGLLDTYKSRITEAQKLTPAEAQDPLSDAGSAVKSAFGDGARTDRKLQGKSTARDGVLGGIIAGAKTDFYLNNSN